MLKRFLFVLLLLGFVISVPYEVSAAPKKETRKERRERQKREEERRKKRQKTPPQKKKITPTFEEKLTPAQVNRKIQTIRRRIETAPEDRISTKNKKVLLDVFDDMAQTQIGRYIFEKAHPDLNFKIKHMPPGYNGVYGGGDHCITFSHRVFEDIQKAKTPEQKLYQKLYIAHVTAHEATHSIQFVNNMNDSHNMSFEEIVTINKLFELHSILNETIVRYQIGNLPKHRHMLPNTPEYRSPKETEPGKVSLVPMHLFYKELKEAKMATGVDEKTAERFARTKFVESFWQNNGKTPIQVGNKTVLPTTSRVAEVMRNWNLSYTSDGFERLPHNSQVHHRATTGIAVSKGIKRFIHTMDIDTPASFFRDPKTTSFKMPSSKKIIGYVDGIKNYEMDQLTTCRVSKISSNGQVYFVVVRTTNTKDAQKDGTRTDYHEGTKVKRATYTYKNGKMNGIYREYDTQGVQTMEMPVVNDIPTGEGWILENGTRSRKSFSNRMVSRLKRRD